MYIKITVDKWDNEESVKDKPKETSGLTCVNIPDDSPEIFEMYLRMGLGAIYKYEMKKKNKEFGTNLSESILNEPKYEMPKGFTTETTIEEED